MLHLEGDEVAKLRGILRRRIRGADESAASGVLGSLAGHWKVMFRDAAASAAMLDLFMKVAVGDVPQRIKEVLIHGDLIGVPRDDDRCRPIAVPGTVRKIGMSAIQQLLMPEATEAVGKNQFGLAVKDGTTLAFSLLEMLTKQYPDKVVLALDVSGAFPNLRRDKADNACGRKAARFQQLLRQWYGFATPKSFRGS